MTAIIIAMEQEYDLIKNNLYLKNKEKTLKKSPFKIIKLKIKNKKIIFAISGVGKINAASCTQFIVDKYSPKKIINLGVCGATINAFKKSHTIVASQIFNNDFDTSSVDGTSFIKPCISLENKEEYPLFTQDSFVVEANDDGYYEMEGYAVCNICLKNKINPVIIKSVTDIIGSKNQIEKYNCNFENACKNLAKKLMEII